MNPLVSVVVPTFNRAYCLAETIQSVLAQTYDAFEIIVVDDGSTDETPALVEREFGSEPRVRFVKQANQGVSAARNHGYRLAQGDYVALLDSDDLWFPWKLQLQVACMERHPELGMTWTDMEAIDPRGRSVAPRYLRTMYHAYQWFENRPLFEQSHPLRDVVPELADCVGAAELRTGDLYAAMIMGSLVHTSTTLLRRSLLNRIGGFDEHFRWAGEDFDFHLRTCRETRVGLLDLPTIQYRLGLEDRITRPENNIHLARGYLHTIQTALARDGDRLRLPQATLNAAFANAHALIGDKAYYAGERAEARRNLWQSIRYQPTRLRSYLLLCAATLPTGLVNTARNTLRWLRGRSLQHDEGAMSRHDAPWVTAQRELESSVAGNGDGRGF